MMETAVKETTCETAVETTTYDIETAVEETTYDRDGGGRDDI